MKAFLLSLCALMFLASAQAQSPVLTWTDSSRAMLRVELVGMKEDFSQCVDSGFEVRVRFDLELCRKRSFWYDSCYDTITSQKIVRYDPVGEQYQLSFDLFGDSDEPMVTQYKDVSGAVIEATKIARVKMLSLSKGRDVERDNHYLKVKIIGECRGFQENMAQVSKLLSLGVVQVHRYNSGWMSFPLNVSE